MRLSIFLLLIEFIIASSNTDIIMMNYKDKKIKFSDLDTNVDNKISSQEFIKYEIDKRNKVKLKEIDKLFKSCDKNNDGTISINKIKKLPKIDYAKSILSKSCIILKEYIKALDLNNDGLLTKAEAIKSIHPTIEIQKKINSSMKKVKKYTINSYIKNHFNDCDKDKDGFLTLAEATSRICMMNSDDFFEANSNKDKLLSLKEMLNGNIIESKKLFIEAFFKGSKGLTRLYRAIKACDLNNDGLLSFNEATTKTCGVNKDIFKTNDLNNDNYIDEIEKENIFIYMNFKSYDKNKDGFIEKKEFYKALDYLNG